MTSNGCAADALRLQQGADGSFSLFSERFGEGFHGPIGALGEARAKFVQPAELQRFAPGQQLVVVDVGFGLGTNSAALLEAAQQLGLGLRIEGLEIDPEPLRRALAAEDFRRQWWPSTVQALNEVLACGQATVPVPPGHQGGASTLQLHWGDARQRVAELHEQGRLAAGCDLVLLDAFSPQRCPGLWTLEFLTALARLLRPEGRLITYCCAAAVRNALQLAGLELASIQPPPGARADPANPDVPLPGSTQPGSAQPWRAWSYGTVASPSSLISGHGGDGPLRPLSPMELDHLTTRAAEPYRDPGGQADATEILTARQRMQACSAVESTSAWRRRWGLDAGHSRRT
jgi:tRNA U34 5-methylaminomethyl-2-thiouridine-forming methyltransferase MnmC